MGLISTVVGAASGVINAGVGAVAGTMSNQWKEFFYCDAIDPK